MTSHKELDYAIIGGGIGGLALGLALHQRGVSVKIFEAAHHFGEIGAGVSFTPNAIQAMKICHPGIFTAFEHTSTVNAWDSLKYSYFEYYDAREPNVEQAPKMFDIQTTHQQNGVHRAHFLEELIKLFPAKLAEFGKRLEAYTASDDGTFTLSFRDGTTATAHAIIGCDGIKSHVRTSLFGIDHPCAFPSYTHKYAYRALVPMEDAVATVGEQRAKNFTFYFANNGHVLTFGLDNYKTMNLVAFFTDPNDWPDHEHLTAHTNQEALLKDFAGSSSDLMKLLRLTKPDLDVWAIFDLGDHPPPTYAKGRVCLLGDAAHATSPHHGAGAGMAIEDAAILAELLADEQVTNYEAVEAAFKVYDELRRPRGDMLVQSSRHMGEELDGRDPEVGRNVEAVQTDLARRNVPIHNADVAAMCLEARDKLTETLAKA